MAGKHSNFFLTERLHMLWHVIISIAKWQGLVNSYVYYGKKCEKVTFWDISQNVASKILNFLVTETPPHIMTSN